MINASFAKGRLRYNISALLPGIDRHFSPGHYPRDEKQTKLCVQSYLKLVPLLVRCFVLLELCFLIYGHRLILYAGNLRTRLSSEKD